MARKCFISFNSEDSAYKEYIQNNLDIQMIDVSERPIASTDEDYILKKIREEYLADSTVTKLSGRTVRRTRSGAWSGAVESGLTTAA